MLEVVNELLRCLLLLTWRLGIVFRLEEVAPVCGLPGDPARLRVPPLLQLLRDMPCDGWNPIPGGFMVRVQPAAHQILKPISFV